MIAKSIFFGKIKGKAMNSSLEKLNTAALKLLSPLTLDETYKTIVAEAIALVGASYGSVVLEENGDMRKVYASQKIAFNTQVRKHAYTFKSFSEQIIISAPIKKTSKAHPELLDQGIQSTIFIPLSYQGKAIGVLTLNAKEKVEITKVDEPSLKLFGSMASLAIRKAQLYAQTKSALETRDHFISLASHELRTPLTSINGYIQLLHNRLRTADTVEANWVRELYGESKRLTNLVTELLEVNRIKQGELQFHLQECDLSDFLEDVLAQYRQIKPEREVILQNLIKHPVKFIGDCDKLKQVFLGLFNNADKFSPQETSIELRVKATSARVTFMMTDHGAGISREDINRIFEGFYKGTDNRQEGLGVGLLLAKHIISYHHGTIAAKSKIKKGTTITVTLPILR